MKAGKLLDKLVDILSAERQDQLEKIKSLKKVLKSLRVKKVRLEERLESELSDKEREKISSKLRVISAQRRKGIALLKELTRENQP